VGKPSKEQVKPLWYHNC